MRAIIALSLLLTCCAERSFTVEIPDRYVGWVTVKFDQAGCGGSRSVTRTTIKVRGDGSGCTSAARFPHTSWSARFVYVAEGRETRDLPVSGWGEGGMIWAESTEVDGREYRFFVGSEGELQASWKARAAAARSSVSALPPNSPLQPTATAAPSR